jgi:Tol biopolymer transport system component
MIGTRLGPYEITGKLGEGGMGEVYRATDSKLRREVAIKVLPPGFTENKDRLARFEREAQLLAQLHHPNIASIHGLEESGGTRALILELVEGEDLSARIRRGPVALDEALAIARQIAEALEAAHEKGIVHRDLKPANIKLTAEGTVKVLDFGLAKAMDPASGAVPSAADLARSPTIMNSPTLTAAHGTQLGVILGTAAYMAPEQARGGAVDKRADIWAFGVVLCEMLTGRSLFAADTVSDTLAGVLRAEIDLDALPATTPSAIRRLLRRCLERNPKNRLHDVADARIVLNDVASGRTEEGSAAPAVKVENRPAWPLVTVALSAGLALGALFARTLVSPGTDEGSAVPHVELEIAAPAGHQFVSGLALSADGRRLALVARGGEGRTALWVRSLDAPDGELIPGTTDARYPFWSPDGRRLGFFAQNRLKVTDLMGGGARVLAETGATTDARGGSWGADDRIVYAPTFIGPMFVIDADGGEPEPATRIPEGSDLGTQRFPSFLPDGRRFVYYASTGTGVEPGTLYLGRLGSLDAKRLGPAASAAHYAPPGVLLYVQGDSLVAHRFDDEREELVGHAEPLGITLSGSVSVSGQRSLAASNQGTLVYRADKRSATRLVWVNRRGEEVGTVRSEPDIWHYGPRLSPDERRLAVSRYEPGSTSGGIWIHDLERGGAYPLTFGDQSDDTLAIWSPDGTELAYAALGGGRASGIYRVDARQAGSERLWIPGERFKIPAAWLPGGDGLLYQENDESGGFSLWTTDLEGSGAPRRLGPERIAETNPALSPDGRWVAFGSDATRRIEVYVRRLDDSTRDGALRVSSDGGNFPRWRGDGRELYYVDDNGRVMAVPIELGSKPTVGAPEPLFQALLEESADPQYDVTADGERFLLNRTTIEDRVPVSVVLGWPARLQRSGAR